MTDDHKASLLRNAEQCEAEAQALIDEHTGIRPGWVSCEISMYKYHAKLYRAEAGDIR